MKPFADESSSTAIDGLTVENGSDRLSISGSLDLGRDKAGLANARKLKMLVDAINAVLEGDTSLPAKVQPAEAPASKANPFL